MYDIFISYRRDGGTILAKLIRNQLDSLGIASFLDLDELGNGKFDEALLREIQDSRNVVVLLTKHALDRCTSEDDWVRKEVEHAIAHKKNIIPVIEDGFEWPNDLPETMEYLRYSNGVALSGVYFDASVDKLVSLLEGVKPRPAAFRGVSGRGATVRERAANRYFTVEEAVESARVEIQGKILRQFDQSVYEDVRRELGSLRVLDVGCSNGKVIMDRLGRYDETELLVGIDVDAAACEEANATYGHSGRAMFFQADLESRDLPQRLRQIMLQAGVESFNVVNIGMMLMDLKNPFKLLKCLRKVMAEGGRIIIKDVDDGLNLAYPDDDGIFERAIDICAKCEDTGYRHSGRQLYTLMRRAAYKDVRLVKQGLSTPGMRYEERESLFDIYFSYVLYGIQNMAKKHPANKEYRQDCEWLEDEYDTLEQLFCDDAFFFNLGYVILVGKR